MRTAIVFILFLAAAVAIPTRPQRIIGGSETTIALVPFMASLLHSRTLSNYRQMCGGSIISSRAILSAAHCFQGDTTDMWLIRVGSARANSGGSLHATQSIILHPSFSWSTMDSDIALLRTTSNIASVNNAVQSGSIAGPNYVPADNELVIAAGWGLTSEGGSPSEQLLRVGFWLVNQATCRRLYENIGDTVTANMLCAGRLEYGGRGHCTGDSGGPVTHMNVIIGVCSWSQGCGRAEYPSVSTRVSRFTSWIQANA